MRYREIIESETTAAKKARSVWKATQKKHRAARTLQDTLRKTKAAATAAKASAPGVDRAKRVRAVTDRQQGAKERYADTMQSADDSIRSSLRG